MSNKQLILGKGYFNYAIRSTSYWGNYSVVRNEYGNIVEIQHGGKRITSRPEKGCDKETVEAVTEQLSFDGSIHVHVVEVPVNTDLFNSPSDCQESKE